MATFNEGSLKKKLDDLNVSTQSIQTVSLWLIHHKKHAHTVVNVWFKELVSASESRKLTFMYLANDVIQNSKKKGPEYNKEFGNKLGKVFEHLGSLRLDEKSTRGLNRLLSVWDERNVFESEDIATYRKSLSRAGSTGGEVEEIKRNHHAKKHKGHMTPKEKSTTKLNSAEPRIKNEKKVKDKEAKKREYTGKYEVHTSKKLRKEIDAYHPSTPEPRVRKESENEMSLFGGSPHASSPPADPPEPEQLIEALQELENAATSDALVREKIANLPAEVSDVSLLSKLQDTSQGRALSEKVEEALAMLEAYNKRLAEEMEARKAVARMLHDYIAHQKDLLAQAEETLEEHRLKQGKVKKVREELRAHLQNLPDISKLPSIKRGGLAPLPSAGDLFT